MREHHRIGRKNVSMKGRSKRVGAYVAASVASMVATSPEVLADTPRESSALVTKDSSDLKAVWTKPDVQKLWQVAFTFGAVRPRGKRPTVTIQGTKAFANPASHISPPAPPPPHIK